MKDRRNFSKSVFGMGAGVATQLRSEQGSHVDGRQHREIGHTSAEKQRDGGSIGPPVAVQTPDLKDLPFTVDNGVKVFNLIAEPVKQRIAPNKTKKGSRGLS